MTSPTDFGLLLVDKPVGPTSHDVVDAARRGLSTRRVGHTGTLDPFASGLLLLCVGRATRIAEYLVGLDKQYEARALLGVETDSYDSEGRVLAEDEQWRARTEDDVREALGRLTGQRMQKPPAYSAVKVGGVPAHRRVRRGEEVDLPPRPVHVHRIELTSFSPPALALSVSCSSGTYVRSLAHELGELLGTGCHLTALRRTAVGTLDVEDGVGLEALKEGAIPDRAWVSPARALSHLPALSVDADEARRLAMGQSVGHGGPDLEVAAVFEEEELVAIGMVEEEILKPRKVLARG